MLVTGNNTLATLYAVVVLHRAANARSKRECEVHDRKRKVDTVNIDVKSPKIESMTSHRVNLRTVSEKFR
jgi:hypothetical protein